jgi:hypothetical protein
MRPWGMEPHANPTLAEEVLHFYQNIFQQMIDEGLLFGRVADNRIELRSKYDEKRALYVEPTITFHGDVIVGWHADDGSDGTFSVCVSQGPRRYQDDLYYGLQCLFRGLCLVQ